MADEQDFWYKLNFSLMHHPMEMNALESLKDMKMLGLDLLAGFLTEVLATIFFKQHKFNPFNIGLILGSRALVDLIYYHTVSKTNAFGGSLLELIFSIIVFALAFPFFNFINFESDPKLQPGSLRYGILTLFVLFATARVTNWG